MKSKKLFSMAIAGIITLSSAATFAPVQTYAQELTPIENIVENVESNRQTRDLEFLDGSIASTQFLTSYTLNKANGQYINFWIKNNGTNDVEITINGKNPKVFKPGESGHTYTTVTGIAQKFEFKAVASPSGKVDIDYKLAQRDKQQ